MIGIRLRKTLSRLRSARGDLSGYGGEVRFDATVGQMAMLEQMTNTGLWGKTPSETAEIVLSTLLSEELARRGHLRESSFVAGQEARRGKRS